MNHDELNGWKEIAAHLGKAVRTAQRWEADLGLPVRRIPGPGGEIIYALRSEIDQWKAEAVATNAGQWALQAADEGEPGNGAENRTVGADRPADAEAPSGSGGRGGGRVRNDSPRRFIRWIATVSVVLSAGTGGWWWLHARPRAAAEFIPGRHGAQSDGLARGGWPTFAHDMQRSNQSDLAGPVSSATPRLVYTSPAGFDYSAGIGETDPSMMVATARGALLFGTCGSISAIDLDGRTLWQTPLAERPFREGVAGIALTSTGQIFVATHECPSFVSTRIHVYKLRADGKIMASFRVGEMSYPPGIAPTGDWFTVSDTNLVRAFSPSSEAEVWMTDLPGYAHGAVALDSRGNLFIGTTGGDYNQLSLWSLEPKQGHVRWSTATQQFLAPVVTDDDRVCAAGSGELRCYDHDGRELWRREIGSVSGTMAPLAFGHSGTIYARSVAGLLAFGRDGTERWRIPPGDGPRLAPGPILDKDENVYVALGHEVRSYTQNGKHRWSVALSDPGVMIIAADGVLCVTSERRRLYAIESAPAQAGQVAKWPNP